MNSLDQIEFNFEDVSVPDFSSEFFRLWISNVITFHKKQLGELNYIFCSDEYILDINNQYLKHDYYTDIITFNYVENDVISGDIFISVDTVKSNSDLYNNSNFKEELDRVIIHGVLHLIGFNDKTDSEQLEMTKQENIALGMRDGFT